MSKSKSTPILVTGGTGKQGGAVARALLAHAVPVRALVRNPISGSAEELNALGATLVTGDLMDKASLSAACEGVRAVFSVQMPDMNDLEGDGEQVMGRNLIESAKKAGVEHFVHSSVSGAGDYARNAPGYAEGRWDTHYWESKAYAEDLVRSAGFRFWTILKPAFFMENFVRPSFLFAGWTGDRLLTALRPETELSLVAVQDIGTAAAVAFAEPGRFDKIEVELAGDRLSMSEIAAVLSEAMHLPLEATTFSSEEAIAQGVLPALVGGQEWLNEVGSPARPAAAQALGLAMTDFRSWAEQMLRHVTRVEA